MTQLALKSFSPLGLNHYYFIIEYINYLQIQFSWPNGL